MTIDEEIRTIARRQLGLLSRSQLHELGVTRNRIHARVHDGRLERLSPQVFRIGGAPASARQRVLASVFDLGVDAAASHTTSAALWGLPGYDLKRLHVTRLSLGNRRPSNLAVVHEPKLLLPGHLMWMGPLRVTTPSRMLFEIAAIVHPDKLARTIDDALAQRLTNVRALHEMFRHFAKKGRTGTVAMRAALDDRPPGYRPPESHLEARVQTILRRAGLPEFERQVDVGDDDGWIGRVDFLHRPSGFILQADGDRWHTQLLDRIADAAQVERLERAGYTIRRVTEAQVWLRPREVAQTERDVFLSASVGGS